MENSRSDFYYIGEGLLRGFILTLVLLLAFSLVVTFATISEGITSGFILVSTMISIIYSAIYATKKICKRGWINGIIVAVLYMLILYIVSMVAGRDAALSLKDLWRVLLAVATGALSGMLGINL